MKALERMICERGEVRDGNILKVDCFLNHQLDIEILEAIGEEFYRIFKDEGITRILTLEASGIAVAVAAALKFRQPVVFAKKTESLNLDRDAYSASVYSYTRQREYKIKVSKRYLCKDDVVLILDDFLARGSAINGMIDLCLSAGAKIAAIGAVIEKCFQEGGASIRAQGYHLHSLAMVESMNPQTGVVFRANPDDARC